MDDRDDLIDDVFRHANALTSYVETTIAAFERAGILPLVVDRLGKHAGRYRDARLKLAGYDLADKIHKDGNKKISC